MTGERAALRATEAVDAVQALWDRLREADVPPTDALNALISAVAGLLVTTADNPGELTAGLKAAVTQLVNKVTTAAEMGLVGAGHRGGGRG